MQGGEIDSGERRVYSASASRRIVVAISRSSTLTSYFSTCIRAPARENKNRIIRRNRVKRVYRKSHQP